MGDGTNMSEAEWKATRLVRILLAYRVGLLRWGKLTDDQRDEAVRRDALDAGAGDAYALECVTASEAAAR